MPVWLKDWWPVLVVIGNLLGLWLMWSMSRKFMTREDCGACREKLGIRVTSLESSQCSLDNKIDRRPPLEALHEIALKQQELAGDVEALTREVAGVKELLERIEHPLNLLMEHHLNRRGASS